MRKNLSLWCWLPMVLAVSACDQQFKLISDDGLESRGTLTIHTMPPHDIAVNVLGTEFIGQWRSTVVDETEKIRRDYGTISHTYQQYVSGLWNNYLRQGHASLQGPNGRTLECDFAYRGEGNGKGTCADGNGGRYVMIL